MKKLQSKLASHGRSASDTNGDGKNDKTDGEKS